MTNKEIFMEVFGKNPENLKRRASTIEWWDQEFIGQPDKVVSDTLTVTFDSSLDDEAGICVSRVVNGEIFILKMELGEQADILYHLLTEQSAKAEIKAESEE